jgi:hypothetical protein
VTDFSPAPSARINVATREPANPRTRERDTAIVLKRSDE